MLTVGTAKPTHLTRSLLLTIACAAAGFYGVGAGMLFLPVGLFVGPHAIYACVVQIAVGVLFLLACWGILRRTRWGYWLATATSTIPAACGVVSILRSLAPLELAGVLGGGGVTILFACLGIGCAVEGWTQWGVTMPHDVSSPA
jgi:hypothetical protein